MSTPVRLAHAATRRWRALSPLASDAVLYGLSGAFALAFALTSNEVAQVRWAWIALPTYLAVCVVVLALRGRSDSAIRRGRRALLIVTALGATALPLGLEAHWRGAGASGNAQPEVGVIERSGSALSHGQSPYHSYVDNGHLVDKVKGLPAFDSFFPYLPLMGVFGLPSAEDHRSRGLTDARILMTLFTVLVTCAALMLMRSGDDQRLRVAQFLLALPVGALFLATGGDDMPVLALCLLGVAGLQRRSTTLAGVSFGLAAALKLTAWPVVVGGLVVTWGLSGWRAALRQLTWTASIVAVTVTPFAVRSPRAFLANVLAFPLGLAHVPSPAASDLPGHLITLWWPTLGHALGFVTFVVGGTFTVRWVMSRWPLAPESMLMLVGTIMAVAMSVASATRIGYLVYPVNLWLWSGVVRTRPSAIAMG